MPRRPKKGKSPSLLIRNLVKELNPIELTILRSSMLMNAKQTIIDIKSNPEKYKRSVFTPEVIESTMDKCQSILEYEEV
jgi:hypothetical protein